MTIFHSRLHLLGPVRRFRRICDHICANVLGRAASGLSAPSPRMSRRPTRELSDTSSCGSCNSDSLSPTPTHLQISDDAISLAAAVVNSSTTNLTGALARCKSDQDAATKAPVSSISSVTATADLFKPREPKILERRATQDAGSGTARMLPNISAIGRRLSLEPAPLHSDAV